MSSVRYQAEAQPFRSHQNARDLCRAAEGGSLWLSIIDIDIIAFLARSSDDGDSVGFWDPYARVLAHIYVGVVISQGHLFFFCSLTDILVKNQLHRCFLTHHKQFQRCPAKITSSKDGWAWALSPLTERWSGRSSPRTASLSQRRMSIFRSLTREYVVRICIL